MKAMIFAGLLMFAWEVSHANEPTLEECLSDYLIDWEDPRCTKYGGGPDN